MKTIACVWAFCSGSPKGGRCKSTLVWLIPPSFRMLHAQFVLIHENSDVCRGERVIIGVTKGGGCEEYFISDCRSIGRFLKDGLLTHSP